MGAIMPFLPKIKSPKQARGRPTLDGQLYEFFFEDTGPGYEQGFQFRMNPSDSWSSYAEFGNISGLDNTNDGYPDGFEFRPIMPF